MANYNFKINVTWKYDKLAKAWIMYSKKYDVSAYGRTKKKAKIMFDIIIADIIISTKPKPVKKK